MEVILTKRAIKNEGTTMKQTLFNKNFISLWTWDLFTLLVVKLRGIIIPLVILNATSSSQTVASVSLVQ